MLLLLAACCARGQSASSLNEPPARGFNVFIDRFGLFRGLNYGYSEWFEVRPTRSAKGFEFKATEALTIDHEPDFDQATSPDGHGKIWYQLWTRFVYQFPKQVASEVVFFRTSL